MADLDAVLDMAERARRAQQAINELGAGPPDAWYSTRTCFFCGGALSAHAGFIETISQPAGERRDFCSSKCLRLHLAETGNLL